MYALGLRRLICPPLAFATTQPVPPPLLYATVAVVQKELDGQFALVLHNDVVGLKKVKESVRTCCGHPCGCITICFPHV